MNEQSFACSSCGKVHAGLPTDWSFKLPDEVFDLSYLETYRRVRSNSDLCALDEQRYFIRGLLNIPFADQDECFAWGVWVEVDQKVHDFYLENFYNDFIQGSESSGRLANAIPGFERSLGQSLEITFQDSKKRPLFRFQHGLDHPLAIDQRTGIDAMRHHEYLESCGYFNEENG